MITVKIKKNKNGLCCGFLVEGHAGYDKYGRDIICASVSVLVINTINSIMEFTSDELSVDANEDGRIDCSIVSRISEETRLLLDSLFLGLKGIEKEYGRKYIQVYE